MSKLVYCFAEQIELIDQSHWALELIHSNGEFKLNQNIKLI